MHGNKIDRIVSVCIKCSIQFIIQKHLIYSHYYGITGNSSQNVLSLSQSFFLSLTFSLSLSLKFDIMLLHFIYSNEVTEYEHLTALPVLSTRICNIVYFTAVFCYNFQMGIYVMQNYTHLNGEYPQFKKTTCITL